MKQDRSLGVSIISGFEMVVGGLMTLLIGVITVFHILSAPPASASDYVRGLYSNEIAADIILIAVSGLTLLAGILTFVLHQAGRILNLFLSSCWFLIYITWFIFSPTSIAKAFFSVPFSFGWLFTFTPLLLSVIFIVFFFNPNVEKQFKK
jgi:lysylphosphatidylglycerol synthetase-like protein (DUF2156 family)